MPRDPEVSRAAHKMILPMQHNSYLSCVRLGEIRAWKYSNRHAQLCPCGGTERLFFLAGHCSVPFGDPYQLGERLREVDDAEGLR